MFHNNPREKIQSDYAKWVDTISELYDWKTHITMEEVQNKYSELAIQMLIEELTNLLHMKSEDVPLKLEERIKMLSALI